MLDCLRVVTYRYSQDLILVREIQTLFPLQCMLVALFDPVVNILSSFYSVLTGTVMSNTWGLARKATAIAVRVLNANGSGTTAYVMQIKYCMC